ncbi:MAG TPA: efflux RND transporter permease subunit, partial [Planctomycetota bacterium]|nr:efflux RND transporter permease subunit [Planctomycetota bacterium]
MRTEYPGAAPIDVEMRVSRRLEEVLSQVRGLRRVSSISRSEVSDVILEFAWGTDMSLATAEVRERASQALLPDDVGQSTLLRYDPTLDPFLQIGLYRKSDSYADREESLIALRIFAEEELEQSLESIPGVAGVRVRGGLEKEIQIDVDEDALRAKRISIGLVTQRLRDENLNQASGILYEGDQARTVRTVNEFQSLDEMRDVVLRRDETVPIRLRDVAEVREGFAEPDVITRIDGRPCVKIDFYKEADANVVEVARRVRERVFGSTADRATWARIQAAESSSDGKAPGDAATRAESANDDRVEEDGEPASSPAGAGAPPRPTFLATRLPEELELVVLSDQSVFVEDALEDVRQTAIVGGALAVVVLLFFLKRIWFTVAVALSIPISVLATWIVMHMVGVSLNMMSLGGLALGIGMLVDSSIVVLESIFRYRESGDAPRRAAVRGTAAVASAVTASTLTTVAVFFPIVFVEGVAGRIFRDQALTVVISLMASLAVSLWLIPALVCRGFERRAENEPGRSPMRRLLRNARPRPLADLRSAVAALPWRGALAILSVLVLPLVILWSAMASIVRAFSWLGLVLAWGIVSVARKLGRGLRPLARGAGGGVGYLFDRGFDLVRGSYDRLL